MRGYFQTVDELQRCWGRYSGAERSWRQFSGAFQDNLSLRPCHIWKSLDSFLKHLSQWGIHQDGNFPWSSVWWSQQTDAGLRSDLQADIFTVHRGPMLTEKMKMQGRKNKIGFLVVGLIWWTFSSWFICFILYLFMCLCVLFWWVLFPISLPPHSNSKTWAPFLARCLWAGNESEFHSVSPHPLQSRVLFPKSRGTKLNQTNNQTNKQTFSISTQKDLVWL